MTPVMWPFPRRDQHAGSRRGQSLVEVALVLPIFILTLIAIIEFGYWAAVNSAVQTASREGARYGSTVDDPPGSTPPNYVNCTEIVNHAKDRAEPIVDLTGRVTVAYERNGTTVATCPSVTASSIQRWDRVQVTVTYTYSALTPVMGALIGTHTVVAIDRRSIVKQ